MSHSPQLLALNIVLALIAAGGLAALTRPRRASAWIAGGVMSAAAVIVVMSEIAGRIAYTPLSLTLGTCLAAALGLAACFIARRSFSRPIPPALSDSWATKPIVWAFLAVWAALAVWIFTAHVLAPPDVPDALRYHLAAVAHWHAEGRITQITGADYRVNHFPHVMSLLWGWPLVLTRTDFYSGLFPVLTVFLLWPATVYLIAAACGARRDAGIVLALCSAAVAPVFIQGMNEAVDVLFWSASLLTFYLAFTGREGFGRVWLAIGLAAGLALGAKSFGIVSAPLALALWFGLALWRARKDAAPLWPVFARAVGAGLIALLIGGWVYGYNFLEFGNPLYPYDFPIDLQAGQRPPEDFYRKAVIEGGASPLTALFRVIMLLPAMLLALPPLADIGGANSSGLGYMSPVLLAVALVLLAAAAWRWRRSGAGVPGLRLWASLFGAALIVNYVLASQWGVQLLNKATPDFSSLARYQLVWPALLATLAAVLTPARAWLRAVLFTGLAVAFIGMTGWFVMGGQSRGWQTVERLIPYFPDRMAQAARINPGITPGMVDHLNKFQGASLLELGSRGHIYPLFYPTFIRKVYKSGYNTLDSNVLFNWDFDRDIYDVIVTRKYVAARLCIDHVYENTPELYRRSLRPTLMHAFNDQVVFGEDVLFVIAHAREDREFAIRNDPRYRLIESYPNRAYGMTSIYRLKNNAEPLTEGFEACLKENGRNRAGRAR